MVEPDEGAGDGGCSMKGGCGETVVTIGLKAALEYSDGEPKGFIKDGSA